MQKPGDVFHIRENPQKNALNEDLRVAQKTAVQGTRANFHILTEDDGHVYMISYTQSYECFNTLYPKRIPAYQNTLLTKSN